MKILILTLLICINFSIIHSFKCGHHHLKNQKRVLSDTTNDLPHHEATKRVLQAAWEPIRMKIDYTKLNSQTDISLAKRNAIKQIMDNTIAVFEKLLKVKRLTTPLKISPNDSCFENYLGATGLDTTGVEADFVYFPMFYPYTDSTEAASTSCLYDGTTGRPIAGYVYIGTNSFDETKKNWLEYFTLLVLHEATHALVFNDGLFGEFRDSSNNKIPTIQTVKVKTVNGVSRKMIISPKVIQAAKDHFGCDNTEGVELEEGGGEGTAGSHWEARVMLSDYMIGVSYEEVVLSEITLALFEDSGWYMTNKYTGGLFRFGKGQGCSFLNTKCIQNQVSAFPLDFCAVPDKHVCTSGMSSTGICSITQITDLPSQYNYFGNTNGGFKLADYCPIANTYYDNTMFFPANCIVGKVNLSPYGEIIGTKSACFVSNIKASGDSNYANGYTICLPHVCDYTAKTIEVTVGNTKVICPTDGGDVTVTDGTKTGNMVCPKFSYLCSSSVACSNMITCALASSTLVGGYVSNTSTTSTPSSTSTTSTIQSKYHSIISASKYIFLLGYILLN